MRQISIALREGDGQLAGRIDCPGEDVGQGLGAADTRIPCLNDAGDLVDPGHGHSGTGFQHDNSVGIRRRYLLDQGILIVRKRKARHIHVLRQPLIRKHNRQIGAFGQARCRLRISSGIEVNFRVRQFRLERFQGRGWELNGFLPDCRASTWRHKRVSSRRIHLR